MMRIARLALSLALLSGMVMVLPAAPAFACSGPSASRQMGARHGMETVRLETFEVTMESVKKSYRRGETAQIKMTVVRPGQRDPLGQGIPMEPPEQFPAEDVTLSVGLRIGDVFLAGWGVSDANGEGMIEVQIKKYVRPGRALAVGQANKRQFESPCLIVEEWGYISSPFLFKVL